MRCVLLLMFAAGLMTTPAAAQSSNQPISEDESFVEGDLRVPDIFRDVPRPRSHDLRVPDIFRNEEGTSETVELRRRPRPALTDLRIPDIFRNRRPVRLGARLTDPTTETREPPADRPGLGRVLARP